jgi:hypothetical protein
MKAKAPAMERLGSIPTRTDMELRSRNRPNTLIYLGLLRFAILHRRDSIAKTARSRGCVGTRKRYCRGPAGVQDCASPIAAICCDFQYAAERS